MGETERRQPNTSLVYPFLYTDSPIADFNLSSAQVGVPLLMRHQKHGVAPTVDGQQQRHDAVLLRRQNGNQVEVLKDIAALPSAYSGTPWSDFLL